MQKKINLLIAEDDLADINLLQTLLEPCHYISKINFVRNGLELTEYLKTQSLPDLILLDLNMPKKNGRESLKEIKNDDRFKQIPVLIFTSSEEDSDVLDCYSSHANSYIKKPLNLDNMKQTVKHIEEFWFKVASLPHTSHSL